jgi:hypothetical protein
MHAGGAKEGAQARQVTESCSEPAFRPAIIALSFCFCVLSLEWEKKLWQELKLRVSSTHLVLSVIRSGEIPLDFVSLPTAMRRASLGASIVSQLSSPITSKSPMPWA